MPIYGSGEAAVIIDGRRAGKFSSGGGLNHGQLAWGSTVPPVTLVSRSLNNTDLETVLVGASPSTSKSGTSSGRPVSPVTLVRPETEASAWSESWLAYTAYDAVIVRDDDLERSTMAESVRITEFQDEESDKSYSLNKENYSVNAPVTSVSQLLYLSAGDE